MDLFLKSMFSSFAKKFPNLLLTKGRRALPYSLAFATVACLVPGADATETESKLKFPGMLQSAGERHFLMGVALRKVTIFGIHAYAAGVYFAESSLCGIKDKDALIKKNPSYTIRLGMPQSSLLKE